MIFLSLFERERALTPTEIAKIAAVVIEPRIQGAGGRLWASGTLRAVREWCSRTDTLLIINELMTGFGRTGRMFASEHEGVTPDMMVPGKGLTGWYLPLAITLSSEKLFSAFNGSVAEGKALAYRHSRSRLHRSAKARSSDQTDLERRRPDAALVHHNRAVNQNRGIPPRVDHESLAIQQCFLE